jgi:hypothetical protein
VFARVNWPTPPERASCPASEPSSCVAFYCRLRPSAFMMRRSPRDVAFSSWQVAENASTRAIRRLPKRAGRWKSRTEDRGVGCYPIRASNDFSFEAEEAAIAEAASGINPLDQRMQRERAIPSAGAQEQGRRFGRRPLSRAYRPFIGPIFKVRSGSSPACCHVVCEWQLFARTDRLVST